MIETYSIIFLASIDGLREELKSVFGADQAGLALAIIAGSVSVTVVAQSEAEV